MAKTENLNEAERKTVRFIESLLAKRGKPIEFALDESLLLSGKLDSLSIAQIIVFLEQNFAFDLSKIQFDSSTFESAEKILRYCKSERQR